MVTKATETVIKCDACGHEIIRPLSSNNVQFANLGEMDVCRDCACTVLETLFIDKKIEPEEIQKSFRHYIISARADGHILC